MRALGCLVFALSLATVGTAVASDSVAGFYRDRTVNFIVSTEPGGGYDLYARSLARHLGKHIPGNPNIVVQNMVGGGGIRAMNYLYNVAPKDGSTIAMMHSSVPLAPIQGVASAKFDATKLGWIGSMNKEGTVCISSSSAGPASFDDLRQQELIVGSSGTGSYMSVYPQMLNRMLGTKLKVVAGYTGGAQVLLAIDRGELQGVCGFNMTTLYVNRPGWIKEKKMNFLVQTALEPGQEPELQGVPMAIDMAKTPKERAVMEIMFANHQMDRPIATPPGVPAERLEALRSALKQTLDDPAFKNDAQRLTIRYVSGQEVQELLERLYKSPAPIREAVTEVMTLN